MERFRFAYVIGVKKILYIVIGALLVFGLLFLLWTFFFNNHGTAQNQYGSFGSAGTSTNAATGSGLTGNGQVSLGQSGSNAVNGSIPLNSSGATAVYTGTSVPTGGGNGSGAGGVTLTNGTGNSATQIPGVEWLTTPLNTPGTNSLANGANGFTPTITTTINPNGGSNLALLLAGTAIAGTLSCALQAGLIGISTGALGGSIPIGGTSLALSVTGVPVSDLGAHTALNATYALQAGSTARNAGKDNITFMGCIVNTIAKTALAQITASVVNWINSGFNGQPSFITNFQQFFANVADLAAGQFIQGSGLSFLCSAFQPQIKIAIAQAYANRNAAASCSLSKVVGNVTNFMNGNFASGGWGGLLSFTTVPTNNPYGAYAYAQVGLANAQSQALANAKNNITPNGFISLQQVTCGNQTGLMGAANSVSGANQQAAAAGGSATLPAGCKASVTTPGTVIENSLSSTLDTPLKQLGLANDLDQIISALTTQLMTRVLQNGLTSLSQSTTQTPEDIAAQAQATSLLTDMQTRTSFEQQLGSIYQGSVSDLGSAEQPVNDAYDCWLTAASSSNVSTAGQQQAATAASAASSTLTSMNGQINGYNDQITQVNAQIAELNQFQLQISSAATQADVANVTTSYNAAVAAGSFASQTDVTTAQQNRTTLQAQMSALAGQAQSQLTQCQALIGS